MRILVCEAECVVGNSRYPIKDAFEDLGHRVDIFDWNYYFPHHSEPSSVNKIKKKLFEHIYISKINKHLRAIVSKVKYDLILVMMGKYIYPETVIMMKKNASYVVNWSTDDIFNMKSSSQYAKISIPLYNAYFTPRPDLINEFHEHGAKNVFPLEWHYRPGMLDSASSSFPDMYKYTASFVGSWSKRREEFLSPLLFEAAHIYGWGWRKKTSNKTKKYSEQLHDAVSIEVMHTIFRQSAININILTVENRDVTALRYFEIPSVKGFQLAERSHAVLKNFIEDKEIVCFSDANELLSKYKFYLSNENARKSIAMAGFNRLVRDDYSLESRLRAILKHLKDLT